MIARTILLGLAGTALTVASIGCAPAGEPPVGERAATVTAARVGIDPVPAVRKFENHSSALIAWRQAGVRNRVLVHLDGHSDLDWLPDETVGRIAAADPANLRFLEHHPYAMDGDTMRKFGIWNFVYPAARLGIVRTFVWVVPDGTLTDAASGWRLAREVISDKLERVGLAEAAGLRVEGGVIVGEILGIPLMVCELADLPDIGEPVLLDIDLDYFTTSSATTMHVTTEPWITPDAVLATLRDKGVTTDVVTLSLSTIGGYLPPENRWIGTYLESRLRDPDAAIDSLSRIHRDAAERVDRGDVDGAVAVLHDVIAERPDDACAWHCLSEVLERAGRPDEAAEALRRSITLDPVLGHASLFEGDRHWLNGDWERAREAYRRYLDELPVGPFTAYALRREAGALMRLRRDVEAIALYEQVVGLAPEHADSLLDLGVLYREQGDLEGALELFRRARAVLPERSSYALALGTTLVVGGRVGEGIEHLQDAVEAKPTSLRARANLAAALIDAGRETESVEHVRVALSIDPGHRRTRFLARQLATRGVSLTER